jgi:hypothetical protein
LHYAKAFGLFERGGDKKIKVLSTTTVFGFGCEDPKFFPFLGETGDSVVTKDTDFRKIQLWIPLIKQYGVGVFFFKTPKKMNRWIEIPILAKTWPKIREIAISEKPPFLYQFNEHCNLKELSL